MNMVCNIVPVFFPTILLALVSLPGCQPASKDDKSNLGSDGFNKRSNLLDSSFLPITPFELPHTSDPYDFIEEWDEGDYIHDIDELETVLGGPLENRRFVSVRKTGSFGGGKYREVSYKFRTNAREKRDSIKELKKDPNSHPPNVNMTQLLALQQTPNGFTSNTIYYHHSLQLSALERIQVTNATIGSLCEPKSIVDHDFCERAPYPNKNKMVCNKVINDKGATILPNTCTCKFYRYTDNPPAWKQMIRGKLKMPNGDSIETCLVPAYGVCDHRQATGIKDIRDNNIFEVDVCKGHYQCDNTKYMSKLIDKSITTLQVTNHCTENDFLRMFETSVRDKILLCAKPHPRRFNTYDEYKYYCLPKKSRDPEQWYFRKPASDEEEKERELFFSD